jgi:hypothetical protein
MKKLGLLVLLIAVSCEGSKKNDNSGLQTSGVISNTNDIQQTQNDSNFFEMKIGQDLQSELSKNDNDSLEVRIYAIPRFTRLKEPMTEKNKEVYESVIFNSLEESYNILKQEINPITPEILSAISNAQRDGQTVVEFNIPIGTLRSGIKGISKALTNIDIALVLVEE